VFELLATPVNQNLFDFVSYEAHVDRTARDERSHEEMMKRFQKWSLSGITERSIAH
jgi:hypothetical protein